MIAYLTASSMMATTLWASARSMICTDFACVRYVEHSFIYLRYVMLDAIVIQVIHVLLVHVLSNRYVGVEVDVLHRCKCCMAVPGYFPGMVVWEGYVSVECGR